MLHFVLIAWTAVQQAPAVPATQSSQETAPRGFFKAVERGDIKKLRSSFVYAYDKDGRSALHVAAEHDQRAAFSELLAIANKKVKDAVAVIPSQGQTAVTSAMIEAAARSEFFDKSDSNDVTPLMLAAGRGWEDLVKVLLDGEANVRKRDKESHSAADHAEAAGFKTLAEYIRTAEKQKEQ